MRRFIYGNHLRRPCQHRVSFVGKIGVVTLACGDETCIEIVHLGRPLLDDCVKNHVQGIVPRQLPRFFAQGVLVFGNPFGGAEAGEEEAVFPQLGVFFFFGTPADVEVGTAVALPNNAQ